jgi:hypothetical protein
MRLASITLIVIGLCFTSAHSATLLIHAWRVGLTSFFGLLLAGLLLTPSFFLVIGWPVIPSLTTHALSNVPIVKMQEAQQGKRIIEMAEQICRKLEVSRSVNVVFLQQRGFSPLVIRSHSQPATLLLPQNIYPMAERACQGDAPLAKQLIRFVLAHELAHVRNGDLAIVPFLSLGVGLLLWTFGAILAVCLVNDTFFADAKATLFQPRIWNVLVPGFLLLSLILRFTISRREIMADQVAAYCVSEFWLRRLVLKRCGASRDFRPLEGFLISVRHLSLRPKLMGIVAPLNPADNLWRKVWNYYAQKELGGVLKNTLRWRLHLIWSSAHGRNLDRTGLVGSAFAAGLLGAFLFSLIEGTTIQDFEFFWMSKRQESGVDLNETFLRAIHGWVQAQNVPGLIHFAREWSPFLVALAMSFILILRLEAHPLRKAFSMRYQFVFSALLMGLMCAIFLVAADWLRPEKVSGMADWLFLRLQTISVCGWVCLIFLLRSLVWSLPDK